MLNFTENNKKLLNTFKLILEKESLGTQRELSKALSERGFNNISQTTISRLLSKVGAFKIRNTNDKPIYKLRSSHFNLYKNQTIDSTILNIQHNNVQIVVKTIAGGANIISTIIESMPPSIGIIGCIASNNTILVIPDNTNNIDIIAQRLITNLKFST